MKDSANNLGSYLNNSNLRKTSEEIISHLSNLDISNINNNKDHYLCTQCLKFPYNEKILIKDLFEKNILFIKNNSNKIFYQQLI